MKMDVLTKKELKCLEQELKRNANEIEKDAVGAQWSEHCSHVIQKIFADAAHEGQVCSSWPGL